MKLLQYFESLINTAVAGKDGHRFQDGRWTVHVGHDIWVALLADEDLKRAALVAPPEEVLPPDALRWRGTLIQRMGSLGANAWALSFSGDVIQRGTIWT